MKKNKIIIMLLLQLCLFAAGCSPKEKLEFSETSDIFEADNDDIESSENSEGPEIKNIVVYVCGAVSSPGVYEIGEGSRLSDAVNAAGGLTGEADMDNFNLAKKAEDGEKIRIPFIGEERELSDNSDSNLSSEQSGGKINLNTASKEQLMTLSGVGESKADAIIKYREANGGFKAVEDIMNIEGIKEGVFNKIKDDICI